MRTIWLAFFLLGMGLNLASSVLNAMDSKNRKGACSIKQFMAHNLFLSANNYSRIEQILRERHDWLDDFVLIPRPMIQQIVGQLYWPTSSETEDHQEQEPLVLIYAQSWVEIVGVGKKKVAWGMAYTSTDQHYRRRGPLDPVEMPLSEQASQLILDMRLFN